MISSRFLCVNIYNVTIPIKSWKIFRFFSNYRLCDQDIFKNFTVINNVILRVGVAEKNTKWKHLMSNFPTEPN